MVFKYYADMKDAPLSDLLKQANINTENQLIAFYSSCWQVFPDTGISTGAYIIFYQSGSTDQYTHVPGSVSWSSAESEYN